MFVVVVALEVDRERQDGFVADWERWEVVSWVRRSAEVVSMSRMCQIVMPCI